MSTVLRKVRAILATQSQSLRFFLKGEPEWVSRKKRVDREFDQRFNTVTGGFTDLRSLEVNTETWRDGMRHIASDPEEFDAAIAALPVSPDGRTFIDLGSGKGRALLLASRYPFAKVIGVEFARELVEEARRNAANFPAAEQKCTDVESVHGDAITYELPPTDTVLFLYNPFNAKIMEGVAQHTLASLRAHPRALHVVYVNAFQIDPWFNAGFVEVVKGPHFSILALRD